MPAFTLKLGGRTYYFNGRAVDAARTASKAASKGAMVNGQRVPPGRAQVLDEGGKVLMTCHPHSVSVKAIMSGRKVKRPFAKCTIKPGFKSQIAPRKRKRR